MRPRAGQSALELTIVAAAVLIALVALSQYMRYAVGGRIKAAGSSASQTLFNPESSRTEWTVSNQTVRDVTSIEGGVPGPDGIPGVPVRTTTTLSSGNTIRTDRLQ